MASSRVVGMIVLALAGVAALSARPADAHGEYRQELPNIPAVNGAPWPGVGHTHRSGGGQRNAFGRHFAAAGYTWTRELCQADDDGDGFSNGAELGDPDCRWRKGQPAPHATTSISHPGLRHSVPQPLPAAGARAGKPSAARSTASHAAAAAPGSRDQAPSLLHAPTTSTAEPNADMAMPQGSERNLNGDQPQRWCEARAAAAAVEGSAGPVRAVRGVGPVGGDQQWLNISLPRMTVLGSPDLYSCHPIRIPDSIPGDREFVGVRVGLDASSHLHHILLMECPGDLFFLQDITRNSEMCTTHSGTMFNACNRWWVATEAGNDYEMCTPPGLIYARARELRAHNKVLVLQVHWVFGAKLQNTSVTLDNASLQLLHEDPPHGHPTHIMETIEGTAVYPPSLMQHVNGLVIPPRQPAYTASYSCAKRCTYVPLGGLSNPQPVSIAGYTFHGHHFMTGMRMSIKRCPLTRLPDVSWEVTDWLESLVHPTYDVLGQGVQLFPGDTLSWSCTYNTSGVNRTVYGGYAGFAEEMCIMLLHYYPRNALLRGCSAVTPEQGGHSVCMFEGAQVIGWAQSEANRVPVRTMLSPRTLPPLQPGQPQGLNTGYKATIVIAWALLLTGFMAGAALMLRRCRWLGRLHTAYVEAPLAVQRNVPIYLMHIVLDTIALAVWLEPLLAGWCGCTESGPSHTWLLGVLMLYIVVAYALELVWRLRIDAMLAVHHIATIVIITMLLGELPAALYQFADAVILLGAFAVLEQPTYVALLLQRVLPAGSPHVAQAWRVAVWFWFGSKTASLVMACAFIARDWRLMPDWARGLYVCIWALVYSIQVWSGCIQCGIMRAAVAKADKQQRPPGQQLLGGAKLRYT